MRIVKAFFFVLATAIMALCLLFTPEVSGPVSITYTTVIGIYLGLDIAAMIKKTSTLKKGDFESLNVYKYVLCSICLSILTVVALIVKNESDVTTAIASFITSAIVVIGCIIGGLDGNKIATGVDGSSGNTKKE
ncbi:MAG: hypothetical protein L6V86_09095 [Treponema sp.]|nr:MAG: hypothetical protein L6V86_09095 [Treponema sp.]